MVAGGINSFFFSLVCSLAGLLGLSFLIGFHELGHYLFAKLFNISTPSFSIGFGPALFEKKIGDTVFRISSIPLGGYVEIAGMSEVGQGDQEEAKRIDERSFTNKPYYQKLLVLLGGILFNLIFAYGTLVLLFGLGAPRDPLLYPINSTTTIEQVEDKSVAAAAQLKAGDTITLFNNKPVEKDSLKLLHEIHASLGKTVPISYMRAGTLQTASATFSTSARPRLGVKFATREIPSHGFVSSLKLGIRYTNSLITSTIMSFISIFKDRTTEGLGGPLMIISQITRSAAQGFKIWLFLLALISINLAVLNLIPLPILDGGQILFCSIEALFRRQLPESVRFGIHMASWILIMLLVVYLSIKDLKHIIQRLIHKFGTK